MMRRILAIGGGGFLMEDSASPIDAQIILLTGKPKPKICSIASLHHAAPPSAKSVEALSEASQSLH